MNWLCNDKKVRTAADKAVVNEVPVHGEALFKLLCVLC